MKKIAISAVIILIFVGYFWFQKQSQVVADITPNATPTPVRTPIRTPSPVDSGTLNPSVLPTATPRPTATPTPKGAFKDGVYTSKVGDAGYGPLQFKVVVSGGKISDVQFLQYPTDARHSQQLSMMATPILRQETIVAQSANVDIVSGATQTSETFIQMLGSLLATIKA